MLATAPPSDCEENARALLLGEGLTCERVISVDRDSILYLNMMGRARTAWLHRPQRGKLRVCITPGFASDPPEDWHEHRRGERIGSSTAGSSPV